MSRHDHDLRKADSEVNWPFSLSEYNVALYNKESSMLERDAFEKKLLSKETAARLLRFSFTGADAFEAELDAVQLERNLQRRETNMTRLLFINRFLIREDIEALPKDQKRLRISRKAFRMLMENFQCPPAILSCLVDPNLPLTPCLRNNVSVNARSVCDLWYTIPVRVAIPCTNAQISHALSAQGSNQTDPSHYLHLGHAGVDIRRSHIVVYAQHDRETHTTDVLCFDFQDGRWVDYADEPYKRAKETLKLAQSCNRPAQRDYIHVLLHSSAVAWWRQCLDAFNIQLIEHETVLLRERHRAHVAKSAEIIMETNTTLHTMAAHLHRFKAEIDIIEENVRHLSINLRKFCTSETCSTFERSEPGTCSNLEFDVLGVRVRGLVKFTAELEVKTQTTIALSFNMNQMSVDRQIIDSSESMRKIMKATQAEAKHSRFMAKQSQEMAEDMRNDSISMRTIAVLTMLFLPGTAFAAILSMPFFDDHPWLSNPSRVWVWFSLTLPTTALAVLFYIVYSRRTLKKRTIKRAQQGNDSDIELGDNENI